MARKTKEEAERTRTRILASALTLFVRNGYERTTFTDIAARLKLTKGAVYWHFESKEKLLVALVDEMLGRFQRQLDALMPKEELTFPAVAEMMVADAGLIVKDQKGMAFFMLMKTQVKWQSDSMAKVREQLLTGTTDGPYHAFCRAIENDIAAGRALAGTDVAAVAAVAMSIWDGLVRARIERFFASDLTATLRQAYAAMWNAIRIQRPPVK